MKRHRKRRANRVHRFETHYKRLTKKMKSENGNTVAYFFSQLYAFGRINRKQKYNGSNKQKLKWQIL